MGNTIDETGFTRERFQDLRAEKEQQYKDGFGNQELKTDVQSGVGQEISISTFAEDDIASRLQVLLSALDPTSAQGVLLSRLSILMNKRRQDAVRSTVTLTLVAGPSGVTVTPPFTVSNIAESATFEITEGFSIAPSSSIDVEATSIDDGPIEAIAGSLTEIRTPVFGLLSAVNASDASVGRDREKDTSLRARDLNSSSRQSSTIIGIGAGLSDLDGVTAFNAIENNKIAVSPEGIPPKSIFSIVDNGSDSDIAESLIKTVAGGIGYAEPSDIPAANIVSGSFQDPITRQIHTAYWARPNNIRVYVAVDINKLPSYPADGDDRVKQSIEDWVLANMEFGEELFASQLYVPVQEIEGAIVVSLFVGTTATPVDNVVNIDVFERASVLIDDVVIL